MEQDKTLATLGREWVRQGLRRRDFLRLTGAGVSVAAISGILAACGGTATETPAPAPTKAAASAAPSTAAASTAPAASAAAPSAAASAAAAASTAPASAAPTSAAPSAAASAAAAATPAGGAAAGYPSGGKNSTLVAVGKKGGSIVNIDFADAKTMCPMLSSDTASAAVISMQFNALLGLNPDTGLPFPDLATEVPTRENGGISSDGLTYTFKIRKDVKFSDGSQLTAKDVAFTYKMLATKELGSPRTAEINERVESVTASDDYTVVFKMKKIVAPFLVSNVVGASYSIVPEAILGKVPVAEIKQHPFSTGDPKVTVGSGPFKFQEWVKDDHITLAKNPTFFRGEPALDKYIFKVVKDANVVVASLKTGEADYGGITAAFWDEMQKQSNVNAVKYDTYGFTFYSYQLDPAKTTIFQDKAVRQALLYALDREAMVQAILLNLGVPAKGTMPVLSFAYQPDKLKTNYTYDPKKAETLLDEAGWKKGSDGIRAKDGKKLQFTLWTNAGNKTREQYVTVMQQQWKAIGVDATPKTEEWNAFLTRITETHDFEVYLVGFSWGIDPDQTTMWKTDSFTGGFNMNKYSNKRVDEICDQALTELDTEKRKALYLELQNIILDEVPNGILDFPQSTVAVNKRVMNMFPNAINLRWNSHTWWVTDGK